MRAKIKTVATLAIAVALILAAVPTGASASPSYTAPYSTVRVGLFTCTGDGSVSERSFPWANLQNVTGQGYGYEVGYFDGDRNFVSLGARIDTDEVSVVMDRNMVYNSDNNSYSEGTGGVTVGCAHILLGGSYGSYEEARAVADGYSDSFVRYQYGRFYVLVGNYSSWDAAYSELSNYPGDYPGGTVDTGSVYTVTVVKTRTNKILFEFDCGTDRYLALRPLSQDGRKTLTWHRGYQYYGDFSFMRNTGGNITTVNYVDVEDYVKGVVCYEMSPSWPLEALKAQAISARTFLMSHIGKHEDQYGFDVCNTIDCQAYHGANGATENSNRAVDETRGKYLMYEGELCNAVYSASNGGASENSENVWFEASGYLRGVEDPYERDAIDDIVGSGSPYYWTRTYTPSSLAQSLSKYGLSRIAHIDMTFTPTGNVYSITFRDVNGKTQTLSKEATRTALGFNSQRYTVNGLGPAGEVPIYVNNGTPMDGKLEDACAVGASGWPESLGYGEVYAISGKGDIGKVDPARASATDGVGPDSNGNFVFSGSGWGHNVGMSQWGAYSMAKYHGKTCEEILTFYYTGTRIVTSGQ